MFSLLMSRVYTIVSLTLNYREGNVEGKDRHTSVCPSNPESIDVLDLQVIYIFCYCFTIEALSKSITIKLSNT